MAQEQEAKDREARPPREGRAARAKAETADGRAATGATG